MDLAELLTAWQQPMDVVKLHELVQWSERQDTATLRAFWTALGHRQRFTRARCLHTIRERWGTALRVGM